MVRYHASSRGSIPMILEGLLTIQTEDDGVHTAAMGPEVSDTRSINQLILKPFQSSRTSDLLSALPEGVFHLTDNVLLFAQAVTGTLSHDLRIRPADTVRGWILEDVCEAFEFRIEKSDTSHDRSKLYATIQKAHSVRPFRGFNRASHAVIEAAILFSRIQFLGGEHIQQHLELLRPLVTKTAGKQEQQAFELIVNKTLNASNAMS